MRMCCGCNKRYDQRQLIRLQVLTTTQALIPVNQKVSGRSAWVCCDVDCINKIVKHPKRLHRSLRTKIKMDDFLSTIYDWIRNKTQGMLETIEVDGALTQRKSGSEIENLTFTKPYTLPQALGNHIHLKSFNIAPKLSNETVSVVLLDHHLRQSTILCIDVLINLKLDSFR